MPHLPLGRCPYCNTEVTSEDSIGTDRVRCPNFRCRRDVGIGKTQEYAAWWDTVIEVEHRGCKLRHRVAMEYMPFQRDGIAHLIKNQTVLLADEMGLGKTIQAIGLINSLDLNNVLIVCPASLKLNWEAELRKWLTRLQDRRITIVNATGVNRFGTIMIINYDILDRFADTLAKRSWDLIIGDESQKIKNIDAMRTLAFLILKAPRRLLLTGTPILNRPKELWTSLHWLDPDVWDRQSDFERRYCAAQNPVWGYNASGASNLQELNERITSTLMLRRMKKDVLQDLPPKFRQVIRLPYADHPALKAEVDLRKRLEMESRRLREAVEAAKELKDDTAFAQALQQFKKMQFDRRGQISKVRHETARLKVPQVVAHLKTVIEETGKVICFAHHRDVIERIQENFASESVILYGGMSGTEKQHAVEAFQNDPEIKLFIGQMQSAGVGLTLTAASNVVFAELDWTPAILTQCEDRAHRIGQCDNVLVQHLVIDGSIDAMIAEKLVEKQRIIDEAINGVAVDDTDVDVDEVLQQHSRWSMRD